MTGMNYPIMKNKDLLLHILLVFVTITALWSGTVSAMEPAFSSLFSSHMVLQRERPISVWGSATPGAELRVSLAEHVQNVRADKSGNWSAELPALPAGGPHRLELAGTDGLVRVLENILIGEVWLCSGQSNTEYPMANLNEPWRDTAKIDSSIRLLTVEHDSSTKPLAEFTEVSHWEIAAADTVSSFSAACYLFARALQKDRRIPFGLIDASWGGSSIEAWISARGLKPLDEFQRALELNEVHGRDTGKALQAYVHDWKAWWRAARDDEPAPWKADFEDNNWPAAPPQLGDWRKWAGMGTKGFTGMVWYRKSFDLNAAQAKQGAVLELSIIDEVDVTWINGKPVGAMFGWDTPRNYRVEPGVLKAGTNVLAVNAYNSWAAGGLIGPPGKIRLVFPDGSHVPLGEGWRVQRVTDPTGRPPMTPWSSITGVTGLFNAMIAPLSGYGLSGVLWYQGESNTGRAHSYENLLALMISDWRQSLGELLPFIVIQLPEFGPLPGIPTDSGWARIRDAQQRVAAADPLSGLVVTVGSADASDIHPPNKRIIGVRAASVARGLVPGNDEVTDGIVPLRALRMGQEVTVHFVDTGMPLFVSGAATPAAFELCDDLGACHYVEARLEQNRVLLNASDMAEPVEVRHAWANAPIINLHGAEGLPVSSFRLPVENAPD